MYFTKISMYLDPKTSIGTYFIHCSIYNPEAETIK